MKDAEGKNAPRVTTLRLCTELILAIAAGSAELIIWQRSDSDPNYGCYLFIYPLILGLLAGILTRTPFWIIGPATMLFYPAGMVADALKGGHGLNLWPIALIFFFILAFIGLIGAAIGRWARLLCVKWGARNGS